MKKYFQIIFIGTLIFLQTIVGVIGYIPLASNHELISLKSIVRSIDGKGNNLRYPNWGASHIPFERFAPQKTTYMDGIQKPPSYLPEPRVVSNTIGKQEGDFLRSKDGYSILLTLWGQFMDHDLSLTPGQTGLNVETMPIHVPKGDPDMDPQGYGNYSIPFKRSDYDKNSIKRNQMNSLTAWIDASMVYGSDIQVNRQLRSFSRGKLLTSGDNLPPKDSNGFFIAGDTRVNENIALTTLHTIFIRQHNRLCDIIYKINPKLIDQDIFQIARNYVIGLIQKITFQDFLPKLIGSSPYSKIIGDYQGYNLNISPNIKNQFATAGFRVGHPILIEQFSQIGSDNKLIKKIKLADMFQKPQFFKESKQVDQILRGLIKVLGKQKSCTLVDSIRNLLFTDLALKEIKLDLFSLNLQRARDHGIPSYNQMRKALGLYPMYTFYQMTYNYIEALKLQSVYNSINQLDLWVGIICQSNQYGAVMGEMGSFIVGKTFKNSRDGDRFWYEYAYPKSVIAQIKSTTLGDIIKRNTAIKEVQQDVFYV